MLTLSKNASHVLIAEAINRYIGETLHVQIRLQPRANANGLPAFITHTYQLFDADILGQSVLIMWGQDDGFTPGDISKHVANVCAATGMNVVYAASSISAHNRGRLINAGIPFIIPGNQLYLPFLAIDLREHFRAARPQELESLSPVAQVVLFDHLLHRGSGLTTPTQIGEKLKYSGMSVGRGFDDLVTAGLATTEKIGKERHIRFAYKGRELFDKALPYLRSPVRAIKYVRGGIGNMLYVGGEKALAYRTELEEPYMDVYAVAASDWKGISDTLMLKEVSQYDAESVVETWSYDPRVLSHDFIVDELSLFAQFKDHSDERVAMAAHQLLERMPW